ncbi:hypothetical protein CRG98_003177, partial [Punica granatum]
MEALTFALALPCEPSSICSEKAGLSSPGAGRRLCLVSMRRWMTKGASSLALRRSVTANGGTDHEYDVIGDPQSQGSFSAVEDEKKKKKMSGGENGLVMDAERDSSGSIVGYQLVSPPQT